jgi:hypothetical protein
MREGEKSRGGRERESPLACTPALPLSLSLPPLPLPSLIAPSPSPVSSLEHLAQTGRRRGRTEERETEPGPRSRAGTARAPQWGDGRGDRRARGEEKGEQARTSRNNQKRTSA